MKFYSKRGHLLNIDSSKIINEIFYNLDKRDYEDIKDDFIFIMQEDKNLKSFNDNELLELEINIVPNAKRKRMQYNFENFEELYSYFIKENRFSKILPYAGEDIK